MNPTRRDGFDELLRGCGPRLLRTAYLLTGDWALAEDLLQTALVKTYVRWPRLRDVAAAEAYVRRVLVTHARQVVATAVAGRGAHRGAA